MIKNLSIGIFLFCAGVGLGVATTGIRKPQIVGFMPYWLLDRADKDYSQYLTTLTYFGLAVDTDGKPIYLVNPQEEEPGWTNLKNDRFQSHNFKSSLLVHSADEEKIAGLIVNHKAAAHALVAEVAPIMKSRGFTDLNLDIESFLEASESARENYTTFVRTVVEDVHKAKLGTVTVEIPPIALFRPFLMDPVAIGQIADYVVLMTYDYHYLGSMTTGAVAPMSGAGETIEFDVETAVSEAVKAIPKEKILLGIPLYGYEWETIRKDKGSATIPGGASTASTRRIEELLAWCATCSAQYDPIAQEPYLIIAQNDYFKQIYYENEASMKEKIALATKYQLGGVALWALGYEDNSILTPLEAYKKTFIVQ